LNRRGPITNAITTDTIANPAAITPNTKMGV
jgi:hypothetical protein